MLGRITAHGRSEHCPVVVRPGHAECADADADAQQHREPHPERPADHAAAEHAVG
jgi:hypothetical protein